MIRIPEQPELEADLIDQMSRGYQVAQALGTAVNMDIFSRLKTPKTAEEVSRETKSKPLLMSKFLNVLVSLKLLSRDGDKYRGTQLAETFLAKESPYYQGNLVALELKAYELWAKLDHALKGEMEAKPAQAPKDAFDRRYILAMAEANTRGPLWNVVKAVSSLTEFKTAKRLLDLGGGHGLHAIGLAQENPQLEATVFDLPPVVQVTKEFIAQYEMGDRVKTLGGDYTKDEIGSGYDMVFVSHTLYGKREMVCPLLKKVHRALNEGGTLILSHWIRGEDGGMPEPVALWELWLTLLGYEPHIYTKDEAKAWLEEAGFSLQEVIDISTPLDPAALVIGRKEAR